MESAIVTNIIKSHLDILLHEDMQLSGIRREALQLAHIKKFFLFWPIIRPEYSVRHLINRKS